MGEDRGGGLPGTVGTVKQPREEGGGTSKGRRGLWAAQQEPELEGGRAGDRQNPRTTTWLGRSEFICCSSLVLVYKAKNPTKQKTAGVIIITL